MGIAVHRRMKYRIAIGALLLAAVYPGFVLSYTWAQVATVTLPGGRNGPLDAYRHTLASAVVAYTLSPLAVRCVTSAMEASGRDANLMDQHNNAIGSSIGVRAHSFSAIEPMVRSKVRLGAEGAADPDQITWLPPQRWGERRWW